MSHRISLRVSPRRVLASATVGALGLCMSVSCLVGANPAQASSLPTVFVGITPSSINVGGALQSGAVNVVTSATGTKEGSTALLLLNPGVSVAEVYAFLSANKAGKDPNTASKFGRIVFNAEGPPGKSEAQTTLAAGQYIALNGENEQSAKWPRASFTVAAAPTPGVLPAPQATVRTIDFAFRGPSTLHDGELVRFENEGYLAHMDVAFPAKSRKAAQKIVNGLLTGQEQGLEKLVAGAPVNFAGPLSTGAYQQQTITAKPGWYVQACFMETQDGRNHTRLGMERVIKITK